MAAFAGELGRNFPSMAALLNGWETLSGGVRVTVIGEPGDAVREALVRAAADVGDPDLILVQLTPDMPLPEGYPPVKPGSAVAIVCRGQSCSLPIADAEALRGELEGGID